MNKSSQNIHKNIEPCRLAVGLMSGTSRDGIDAALIESDGEAYIRPVAFFSEAYTDEFRNRLALACHEALQMETPVQHEAISIAEDTLTHLHINAVKSLLIQANIKPHEIAVIGFHGHTIAHRIDRHWTWQIGNGALMAQELGIAVVDNFRAKDVAAGGQGAPLMPVYHRAMTSDLEKPVAILNLGGVANITAIDRHNDMVAFDCGMASAMIDSWMLSKTGVAMDISGAQAAVGQVNETVLAEMLAHPFFALDPPKSIDRDDFSMASIEAMSIADGAATLTAFSAEAVAIGLRFLPHMPKQILVAGGGRKNNTLMRMIRDRTALEVRDIDDLGFDGDAIEAQGFAYMALRRLDNLPISFSGTTGVKAPLCGGDVHFPEKLI